MLKCGLQILLMLSLSLPSSATVRYRMVDLGAVGQDIGSAVAINNRAQVAITTQTRLGEFTGSFLWEKGNVRSIGPHWAYDINNQGQVVCTVESGFPRGRVMLWQDGMNRDLGTMGGRRAWARHINDNGQIAGWIDTWTPAYQGESYGFLWQDDAVQLLPQPAGWHGYAYSSNNVGQAVGCYSPSGNPQHACLWDSQGLHDLSTLGGYSSSAWDINDAGQVVGVSWTADFDQHAFLWENGVMHDLGPKETGISHAQSINSSGWAAGAYYIWDGELRTYVMHAILWKAGEAIDLGTLGGHTSVAKDINDYGLIVGDAATSDSWRHACLWVPIITVPIDIKPGDPENSINLRSRGLTPVAVLTTDEFDVTALDPSTVVLAGASPVRWAFEDVDRDGTQDMVLHFDSQELTLADEDTQASLSGKASDGREIEGTDIIRIVGLRKSTH